MRVVIDARLRCPPGARLFHQRSDAATVLVTTTANVARARRRYSGARVEVLGCTARGGEIDLDALMRELGKRGWSKVLAEGGAHLAGALLRVGVVDRVAFFVAPILVGAGMPAIEGLGPVRIRNAIRLGKLGARRIGDDWLIEADVHGAHARVPRTSAAK
jgi:diaminohydroxyphosphoribosylaminopyrimidine deaminase/5-amino-6-(5-phosphoribosylamino)uracil reductase